MIDNSRIIYLHGLESSSKSGKAQLFAQRFPGMITPNFSGSFSGRMDQLCQILTDKKDWTIIGSSYGGLMGAIFTCNRRDQVRKLILLAPALSLPEFTSKHFAPQDTPTILIHGRQDEVVPPEPVLQIAQEVFINMKYIPVEDGHRLHHAFEELDWKEIIS
jgi:pimeloyl-ACP methyl ester carboxylesterase